MFNIVKEVESDILRCFKCGECQEVCPVYSELGVESFVARGKIRLMRAVMRGEIELTAGVQERIECCLNCNACMANCPSGVDTDRLVCSARRDMRAEGIPVPENLVAVRKNIAEHGNPFGLPAEERESWTSPEVVQKQAEVAYFAGCAVSYSQNRLAKAALRILDGSGIEYTTLGNEEKCCGDPLIRMGLQDEAEKLADRNRENLKRRGVKTVFTSCAGCVKNLRESLGDGFDVYHVTEYLNQMAEEGRIEFEKPFPKKVAYMDGCDIGRHAGIYEAPRELLARVPGVEPLEFKKNRDMAVCCGGPFIAAYPELARQFAAKRIRQGLEVGAEVIAVACPTCLLNLKEGAKLLDGAKIDIQEVVNLVQRSVKKK